MYYTIYYIVNHCQNCGKIARYEFSDMIIMYIIMSSSEKESFEKCSSEGESIIG